MKRFRKTFSRVGIYLTAFMTLAAGTPHFQCICPNGRLKPFCLSIFSQTFCCAGGCCATDAPENDDGSAKPLACCCARQKRPSSDRGQQLTSNGCTKTLADTAAGSIPTSDAPDSLHAEVAPLDSSIASPSARDRAEPFAALTPRSPPPDLILVLQHFNI